MPTGKIDAPSPNLIDIDPKGLEFGIEEMIKDKKRLKNLSERDIMGGGAQISMNPIQNLWATLPQNILQHLEDRFLKLYEIFRFRLCNEAMLVKWWEFPINKWEYYFGTTKIAKNKFEAIGKWKED